MTILNQDKLKRFREKLYHKKVSKLLRQGGKGLNPLGRYKRDEKGKTLVLTRDITRFFLDQMKQANAPLPAQYIDALFTLLRVMSQGAEPISFDCGFSISQEAIQDADNKTTIDLLTTNIIITYFNTLKTHKGTVDTALLDPGLKRLISKSNSGRDYKELVSQTLKGLTRILTEDRPWQDYLEDLNDADLICRLAGSQLPSMEKDAMAGIIDKSQKEIQTYNELFTKILHTRGQLTTGEGNRKRFLKSMEKLNSATLALLKKTDNCLAAAHRLMGILDLSYSAVLCETDTRLRQNLVWLFLGAGPGSPNRADTLRELGIAPARYRLNMLFNYPDITHYCRSFKIIKAYESLYFDLFRLLLGDAADKIHGLDTADPTGLGLIHQTLREITRAVKKLGLEPAHLNEEKQAVRDAYVSLIQTVDISGLSRFLETIPLISAATQDDTREIMPPIRAALIKACFSNLKACAREARSPDRARYEIKKRFNAYAPHYTPQREFYRTFFDTYIGKGSDSISPHLAGLIHTNKLFASALLKVLSDESAMKDLMPANRISHAAALADGIINKR